MNTQLRNDTLRLGPGLKIQFQRTLRIPDDGGSYPLPAGFGAFPVRRVDDYANRVPEAWREHGGVFLPMYQREAMWILFRCESWKPRAVKVGVGKVCAITGTPWSETLHQPKQDYLVTPPQPWLDGISLGRGYIRQFVAMPLGLGYTVEGQVSGQEHFGGVQLKCYEPRAGLFPEKPPVVERWMAGPTMACSAPRAAVRGGGGGVMGLAAGGRMKQKVYPDPHGLESWDAGNTSRIFVHIVNSELWREITGERPPESPITAKEYSRAGVPWFDLYDETLGTTDGSKALCDVKSVKERDAEGADRPLQDDGSVSVNRVRTLLTRMARELGVRDGSW